MVFLQTSSAIAEIDDRPHGASTNYKITKPPFSNFQNFLRQTDRQTKSPSPIKTTIRHLKIGNFENKIGSLENLKLEIGNWIIDLT